MTNKKLKLAAMSVALTACVAAQPMAAHAVEGPDSVEDNAAPQAEPVAESSTPAPVAEEGEKQEKVGEQEEFTPPRVNEEAKSEEQAPAFGPGTKTDDITIDYKPAAKPEEPGKSGEDGEADGSEGSGETDETENPDGTYVKGDVIDNSKKDEATGKDGKIGEATKEETPDSSSSTTVVDPDAEVKKGDPVVGKDEDGNTTITTPTETTGTETTTTTGTGKADSSTTITDTKKGEEINLDDELGKDVRPDWKTDKDAKLGGYTVDKVEPAKDGNSKTLTLKKTSEPETKEMSAEDVAKLLDVPEDGVEKKTDDEGNTTYTLKKEETSTDENGNTVTRVTYYEITGNSVKTRTETTLVLKVEKGTVDVDDKDLTTKNPDGSTTETIYTFKNEAVTLTDAEKEAAAWKALAEAEHKSVEELQKEGYKINSSTFNEITKTTWTVETKTSKTETTKETLNQTLVDDTWTLEGTTLKTKDGQIYKNLKQNADGTYTATKEENGKTVTYTFTLGEDKSLDDDTIKAMLAKEFPESNGQITLDTTTNTATYKKADGSTVTIDYSNLSKKTLKIDKSVSDAVSVTETIKTDADLKEAQEKLYQELKKKVESIQLKDGEELWIGDLKITDIGTQKEEIIKHFTTAVSHENMSKEALIKALNAQADEAKTTKVTVNQGTKYEETLNNYYSGESLTHNPKEPPTYWNGKPKDLEQRDDITHLDLASGAKMDKLPDKNGNVTQTDCVLLAKNQKLEWNYDADKLVKGDGNTTVGLKKHISKDTEDGKGYHYEYDRLDGKNNNPEKSAFYKLTGTVAYDALKNDDGTITEFSGWFAEEEAVNAYLKAVGRTNESYQTLNKKQREEILGTYVVPITSPGTFVDYTSYQVYTKTAEMTSYGYMTRDANTCVNSTYKRQNGTWGYVGGYDLMISDLVQVSEGKVVGQTQSSIKTLWAPLAVRSTQSLENKSLQLDAKHTSTPVTTTQNLGSGYEEEGSFTYNVSYQHTDNYTSSESQGVQGTGTGKYKTFTQLVKKMFSGKGETSYDEGKVSYTHRTTEKVDTTPVSKETVTTTDAHVEYDYTTIETRTVTVNGEETVIVPPVDPDTPDDPVEDETPDEVVMTPETPELPPVQDTTPDAPVLPSDAVLPAVQDALPQTGVNWMAALGMAFSGMLLTIAGAFASLKYKEKH